MPDSRDNCRTVRNADQRDTDRDGAGDACDSTMPSYVYNGDTAGTAEDELNYLAYDAATATYCRRVWAVNQYWSTGKLVKLYEYKLRFQYCFVPGVRITAIREVTAQSTYAIWPWRYGGTINGPLVDGVGAYSARVFVQGKYEACVVSFGCIHVRHPSIEVRVYASTTARPTLVLGSG